MAKNSRTPFNSARYKTSQINKSTRITAKNTGEVILISTSGEAIDLNMDFLDNGAYFKIIARDDTDAAITLALPNSYGVLIHDEGAGVIVTRPNNNISIQLPSGASAGSYIDLLCDGEKWYVNGMAHGAAWTLA